MTTKLDTLSSIASISSIARRATALVALCVLVAAVTATWLTSEPAQAGPRLDLPAHATSQSTTTAALTGQAIPAALTGQAIPTKAKNDARAGAKTDDDHDDGDDGPASKKKGKVITGKININSASVDQLCMLPGVGPAKAQRIVEYRTSRGKFQRVRDLRRVKGFGYKTVTKLTPYLAVQGETTLKVE